MGSLSVHSTLPYSTLLKSGLNTNPGLLTNGGGPTPNGVTHNNGILIGSKSCWSNEPALPTSSTLPGLDSTTDQDLATLINGWKPYSNGVAMSNTANGSSINDELDCPLHPLNPVLYWCSTCSRAVCGSVGCLKEHPTTTTTTTTPSANSNNTSNTTGQPSLNSTTSNGETTLAIGNSAKIHALHPLTDSSSLIQSAIEQESRAVGNLLSELYHFERKQQDLMLKLIDALQAVKGELESALINGGGLLAGSEIGEIHSLLQTQLSSSTRPHLLTHFTALQSRRSSLQSLLQQAHPLLYPNNSTLLSNIEQLQLIHQFTTTKLTSSSNLSLKKQPVLGPRFYFDMEIVGVGGLGRVVIETRPDVAPRMCENFHSLVRGDRGFGFEGCVVFQCWRGESVITGDFEHQNGRGGHSIFPSGLFMPEDTRLPATRGALGMRRTQKRHDSKGLVGSQFRIILQDMPGFTGIFGHVLEGIEVVERIAECGDASGNPTKRVVVRRCGEM